MEAKFFKGNIVDAKVDAIVLPANTRLKEGSGASEAIFKAAGRKQLTKACKEIGFCEMGSAVPTLGYELSAKYIIHAVVPKWVDGEQGEYDMLSSTYAAALGVADVMECNSMAFPLLASGNNGFDLELSLEIAVKSIESFRADHLQEVILIVYGNTMLEKVQNEGYEVSILSRDLTREEDRYDKERRKKKIFDDAKDVAGKILEEQLMKGINYLKEPKNREKVIQFGTGIVKLVMSTKK